MIRVALFICMLIESLAFYTYTKMLFIRKKSFKTTLFCYGFLYLLVFAVHNFNDDASMALNICLFTLSNMCIILFCYKASLISAIFHSAFVSAISILSEILVGNICGFFIKNYWINWNKANNLLLMSLSGIVFFIISILCGILQSKFIRRFSFYTDTVVMIAVAVCMIAAIAINQYLLFAGEINSVQKCELLISAALLSMALFLSIFLYAYMQKLKDAHAKDLQQLQLEKDSLSFFEEIKSRDMDQRILLHDIKNHLLSILDLNSQSRSTEIDNYVRGILASEALAPSLRYCENDLANSIIYRYLNESAKRKIDFVVDSNNPYLSFVQDFHLTTILCNLLDNAMEAASLAQTPYVHLTITADMERCISVISIDNSCCEKIKFSNYSPLGTKKDNVNHGLGIRSVMRTLKLYHGEMTQYQDDNLFFHTVALLSWRDI